MLTLEESIQIVSRKLDSMRFAKEPYLLYEPIDYILSIGGKRIRPALTLLACDMFGGDVEQSLDVAIGLEIFHNFTLVHDDIMDRSEQRRNQPTVHTRWNNNIAILSGDAMIIKAYELLCRSEVKDLRAILEIFNQTALQVCEGQQYDMDFEVRQDVTEQEYLTMIELKTAVLIAASLRLGATLGGADEQQADLLYAFGRNVGLGFQLQDDYLDCYGEFSVFGKPIGGDIANNKQTYLMIRALASMLPEERIVFIQTMLDKNRDRDERVGLGLKMYTKYGIREATQAKIDYFYQQAHACLMQLGIDKSLKKELLSFLSDLSIRDK